MSRETFVEKQRREAGEKPAPKRGRPSMNLTYEEKEKRKKMSNQKSKEKQELINLAINNALLEKFKKEKQRCAKTFGFELSHKQFLQILLNDHQDKEI